YSIEYFLNRKSILGYTLNLFRRSVRELPTPTKVLLGLAMALPIYLIAIPVSLLCLALLASDMNTVLLLTYCHQTPALHKHKILV
ncbi:MAG: hypothetical protein PUP93_28205, partial [Rhizonema sp. NSF051]|nr:hypothetical protein [Rhizonema sp. NSF051]